MWATGRGKAQQFRPLRKWQVVVPFFNVTPKDDTITAVKDHFPHKDLTSGFATKETVRDLPTFSFPTRHAATALLGVNRPDPLGFDLL